MSTLPRDDGFPGPGDAELISAVREGDLDAYGLLFSRHVDAARRLARQLTNPADADDLVSDAFAKVLTVLQRGGGPDLAFRAYLLTAVRRLHVDRLRSGSRLRPVDDLAPFDPGLPFRDTAVEGFESAAAARAFASLPERWQMVLWHTEVERQKPADVAVLLGMTPNSVSALAYRAREGLRQAFLNQHVADLEEDECRWTRDHLGAYVRGGLSRRESNRVDEHVRDCRACAAIFLELTEVNSGLAALLAPMLLGTAGLGYLSSSSGSTGAGSALTAAKTWLAAHSVVGALGGVAITAAATVVVYAAAHTGPPHTLVEGSPPALAHPASSSTAITSARGHHHRGHSPGHHGVRTVSVNKGPSTGLAGPPAAVPTEAVSVIPSSGSTSSAAPSTGPTSGPTSDPTSDPTSAPSDWPTTWWTIAPTWATTGPTVAPTSAPTTVPTTGPTVLLPTGPTSAPTTDPTTAPTTAPTTDPTSAPTTDPTTPPTTEPTSPPTTEPTTPPTTSPTTPPVGTDLAVTAVQTGTSGGLASLTATVTGLPAGSTATLSVTSDDNSALQALDSRCAKIAPAFYRCQVTAADVDTFAFNVNAKDGRQVTFQVAPVAPLTDDNPADDVFILGLQG